MVQVKTAGRERRGAAAGRLAQHAAHATYARNACAASLAQSPRAALQRHRQVNRAVKSRIAFWRYRAVKSMALLILQSNVI